MTDNHTEEPTLSERVDRILAILSTNRQAERTRPIDTTLIAAAAGDYYQRLIKAGIPSGLADQLVRDWHRIEIERS